MAGEGMVAVVRGLRDAGLAVTLLDGNRQYTLLPNSTTAPASTQHSTPTNANASTQPIQRVTTESSTESSALHCDRDAQAVDGRYTTMYKTMHCNVRPTSPTVQLTEFPPQKPDHCPGHGNFQVGGAGSGAVSPRVKQTSPATSFRGGLSWPDRGCVCSPRPSIEVDAFANSLRKYPCLSPEKSSEVMERLINYQVRGLSRTSTRNHASPTRASDSYPSSNHTLESKGTYTKGARLYEPEVTVRRKMEEPTRERKREDSCDTRNYEVRCLRDLARKGKESVSSHFGTQPYCNPACPTIKETHNYQAIPEEYHNSSNSVNMEIQAAVKMISKEVATTQREKFPRKTVAVPDSPTLSAAEDNAEGECYLVRNLNTSMSIKSIQTSFLPHDNTLKPRKSAQTIASTVDFQSSRHKTVVNRRSKSQEQIKITKEELKKNLLELIEEVSKTSQRKKIIRDELIKKLFESNENERVTKEDRHYKKREQCHKYASTFCPTVCDYVGDYQELLGQLKHCYGDAQQVLQSEVTPFRISEYQQLDFVLKDWINNLDIKTVNQDSLGRRELLNDLEDKIKVVFKNRTKQDFDLKSAIVNVIQEIPIEVNNSYNRADYLHKLVDALIKRMKNVIVGQHYERFRKKSYNKFNKVFTEADIRSFIREHLVDFFNEYSLRTYAHVLVALENELVDVIINAIDCIRCGHIEDARDEMNIIFQELANLTENQAKYVASVMLRDLQQVLNHCNFNHTYMILNMNNNSGPSNRGHFNENIERLNSDDFRENLDRYANQLCQQINQWLDSLNIPQIQDTGIREVVVNDLAADIIDRLKYLELNQINTADEDELEALKYQIFKWINKLVGDDNQETINNARLLLDRIRSVPIPLLIHPRSPQYTLVECPNPECYQDPMRPCLGEFGPGTCSEINRKLRPPTPCCTRAGEEVPCPAEQCCIRETCPEILESQGLVKSQNKSYSTNQDYYRRSPKPQTQSQPLQQPQSSSSGYQSSQDQSSASDKYYTIPDSLQSQEKQLPHSQDQSFGLDPQKPQTFPSSYQSPQSPASVQDKYFASPSSRQNQVKQLPYNQDQSFSLGQQQPQTFPSSYQSPQSQASAKDKYSASPDNQKIRERTPAYNRDKSFGLGQTYGPSNKKWTSNASGKSNAHGPMQLKRPTVNEDIQQSMFDVGGPSGITNSPQGAQTSISIVPGPARPTPHPSIKKILADYDAYLKEWVKKVSIPMNTPSEKQTADKARLDLYNGVYKTITKMKLDPKIFGNPLYFKELFNEEIEKLIKNLPKSKQLEIEKPALSAELLKKTLEMNNLIRSLNVSSTYKQHVIDCVENNSPRAPPLANETDQQNEEIEKHNVADYYILHRRYKDEDNVKANFHKKNFLKSLDDYLENIKKRHDLIGIETYGYANEIINCLDKIPIPNLLALRDEADETLLGMEVENWIADLPQYLDTTGPLDKRRIRDAVVKKIQEVEANVNCNENAFADHLKAELPKYIERIPIKEDINVNFVIDELVNRIRNLDNMKSRPRYVSFQEPQDYEDFVRDVPRASSFHETPGQSNSYYLGGINNADDPRSWVPRNASSPLDDQWQSMQATRAPADLRDWSQTTQSEPFANTQNGPSQVVTTPSHSLNDYGSPRHLPSVSPAQFPLGQEYYNSIAQSAIPPLHDPNAQNGHHPNALKQVDPNNPGDVCTGPCCLNPTCVSKVQGYVNPTQYSQPSTSPFISPGGYIPRMAGQRGVHPGVAVSSPSPQPYGQVNLNPYSCNSNFSDGRCRGPITRYYQDQYQHPVTPLRGNQMHSRGMPVPPTRAPQAPYGQSQLIPQNLQEPIETQRPTYFPGSYIDSLLQNSPYQQPIEAVSRPSIPQPQVPQVQGVPANIFSSRQVPYMPTSEQIPQFAYAQDVPNDTTTPYQAPIGSLFTFPDQGPQHLPDISAPQFKRYTQGTSVAPQERRPLVPHFSKGPIGPISMKTFVKPSLSSQGRFSLGHYGQSNSNDPINIIPDSRRTSQISAVNPKERHFSESSKKSVSNSQYLAPEVEMDSSKKPVDLQERDHTESYIQNVPNKYAETAPTAVSPHESYYLEPQSEPVIKRTSKVLDHRSKILETQSKVPAASLQVTQYSDRQKQFVPNASDSQSEFKIDSKEQAVPQEIRKSKPDEQTYANDKDKIVPSNQSDSIPPVIPFDRPLSPRQQSGKSGRDMSTQVSLRDTEASPQDVTSEQKPWRLSTKVSPKIQYDSHPSDQTYSELPTVVLEGPGPQDLHELKPPSASSAPVSTIPSLDHGSQPPNKQGNSVLSSFKSGGQNKIQSEPIPSAFKERQPNLTTIGDTEVSHERPGGTSADISEVIPYDQMAPKGYSSPTSKTFEPAFQMDPSSPLQTGDVIPDSQISPENVKTQPQTNDITPETQLIQDNQGSQLHSKHPIRSNQIPFNDLQNLQSDFVPFSQAIEIEIWSPIHVEQYPPTVTYEYIPDSISFEKTHFSIQTAKSPALVSAASQAPEEILEVHLPGVVRDGRMYGTGKEPGPCAPESIEAVRKKKGKDDHPSFHKSTDSKDNSMSYCKGTIRRDKTIAEPINPTTKALDKDCEMFKIKSIQTAFSNVDIRTTKYCEIRSKSQEELTKITKKHEVIKRRGDHSGDFEPDLTEWFEIHSDKVKVKLWGDKLKKLADKLKKPGGEEKVRNKIEKYLKQVPDHFSEGDDDKLTYKKQLPDDIIRKLKKMQFTEGHNINVYRMELSKYCSRFKVENFRKAILNWTKTLNIKKRDFLGRNVKKEDILKYIADRLEPIVLDRPQSDLKYKEILKSNITDMVNELPLVLNTHNNEFYLNKITENLVNDILNIETKFPTTYIQPTIKEIKEFVRDEITFFLEKSRVAISTKRMEYLEIELIDILLDLVNATDIDEYVMEVITTLFRVAGKLPEYKAKYFTNLLLKDYKEFFFRESFFHVKGDSDRGRPDIYSVFDSINGIENAKKEKRFDECTQRLIDAIKKWISKLTIPNNDKKVIEVIVTDLANDIVDRHKFLLLNPNNKSTDFEELEYLKFLIFKWTNKLLGEENIAILEHTNELMNEIKDIPKCPMENTCPQLTITNDADGVSDKNYADSLTEQILKWYQNLKSILHLNENINHIKAIRNLSEEIEKSFSSKEDGVVIRAVKKWIETVFKNKLDNSKVEQLTNIIKSVPYTKEKNEIDPKYEKVLIRSYEDLVDEWIDTVPIDPKKIDTFTNNKNEIIHDIAVKISKIKTKIKNTPLEVIHKKLLQELSDWLKKLPLHAKVDKETFRDKYAEKLVQKLQSCNVEDVEESSNTTPEFNNETFQIEEVLLEWLKRRPFYKDKAPEVRQHQEKIMKDLGNKLKAGIDKNPNPDEYIIEYIRKLEPKQNEDILQNIACQLKLYLDKFKFKHFKMESFKKDYDLSDSIELWLNNLPLNIIDENLFNVQKAQFIESIQQLKTLGCDSSILKKAILVFMKSLPIDLAKKEDTQYMNQEASNLMENLKVTPSHHVAEEITENKSKIGISNTINEWVHSLPVRSELCPKELHSFVDDVTFIINRIAMDANTTEHSYEELQKEIVKFLRRCPLESEQNTENDITSMAKLLVKSLENCLPQNKRCTESNSVTVYALKNTNLTAFGLLDAKDIDINENSITYTRQLANQIGQWLDNLGLPETFNNGYKEVAINDLAGDIVDRHKYLEINPNAKENELEHLKYQIFKWINKIVGEENLETITHADDLMRRIKSVPVPMLVRPQDKIQAQSSFSNTQNRSGTADSAAAQLSLRAENNIDTTTSPINMNPWQQVYLQQFYRKPAEASSSPHSDVHQTNSPSNLSNASHSHSSSYSQSRLPDEGTKEAVYEKYQKIFKDRCNALPIDSSTPENAKLADLAKTAIYNGIIKTFFNLKADPEIENDYGYFELMLEEKLDELLDVLPQSLELLKQRHAWKVDILTNAIDMLDQLHNFSDRPSFRQRVRNKFNRKFAKELELEQCFLLQQGFLAEMADAFILETNYKEKDALKANIYKKRLMKKVDELATHLAKEHNVGFRFFNKNQLTRIAMKVLEQVPKPGDEVLQEEAEEIQLGDEVEKWYKDLPTKPLVNDTDGLLRKRMMDLLAKKLYDIHKRYKDESAKEMKMKHEVSVFLEKRAQLQDDQDLNINEMVEDLNNRLKNRWLKEPQDYNEFERHRPISSTFAQVNKKYIPNSSMEASTGRPLRDEEYFIQPGQRMHMNSVHSGSPGASNYIKQEQTGRQSYGPIHVQRPNYANASHMSTNHPPQAVSRPSPDPRYSLPTYATSRGSDGYVPTQRGFRSMREPGGSVRRTNYGPYQNVPKRVTLPNMQRSNITHLPGTSGQAYVPYQNPNVANNGQGTFRSNQMLEPGTEHVSQRQSQIISGHQRQNPDMLHVPSQQRRSQESPTARYVSPSTDGPSGHGGTTAEVFASGGETEAGEHTRCRCMEFFRPRRMCFDQNSRMYHLCPQ